MPRIISANIFFKDHHFSSLFATVNGSWINDKYDSSNKRLCVTLYYLPPFLPGNSMKIFLTTEQQMILFLVNHSLFRETKRLGKNKKPHRSLGDCLQGCRDLCTLIFHCKAISLLGSQSTSQTLMLRFTHGYYLAWVISRAEFCCCY